MLASVTLMSALPLRSFAFSNATLEKTSNGKSAASLIHTELGQASLTQKRRPNDTSHMHTLQYFKPETESLSKSQSTFHFHGEMQFFYNNYTDSDGWLIQSRINICSHLHGTVSSTFSFRKCESWRFTLKRQTRPNRIFKSPEQKKRGLVQTFLPE